jgi:hypothetical protein
MDPHLLSYDFCPSAGILCLKCNYPVNLTGQQVGWMDIKEHERQDKNKKHENSDIEHMKIYSLFDQDMKEKAQKIRDLWSSDKHQEARDLFLSWVGIKKLYWYCPPEGCNKLVYSKNNDVKPKNHKQGKHGKYMTIDEQRLGVCHEAYTMNSPKIIPWVEFNFNNKEFFNDVFWNYLYPNASLYPNVSNQRNQTFDHIETRLAQPRPILNRGLSSPSANKNHIDNNYIKEKFQEMSWHTFLKMYPKASFLGQGGSKTVYNAVYNDPIKGKIDVALSIMYVSTRLFICLIDHTPYIYTILPSMLVICSVIQVSNLLVTLKMKTMFLCFLVSL